MNSSVQGFLRRKISSLSAGLIFLILTGASESTPLKAASVEEEAISSEDREFFEKHIRPVLVRQCLDCHEGSIQAKGGLRLDNRFGVRLGGQRGELLIPGNPDGSLLIQAIKQTGQVRMPPGDKLTDAEIANFEEWVRRGAPDPRDLPTTKPFDPRAINFEVEGQHWSFQPRQHPEVPEVAAKAWPKTDVDRFVLARLDAAGLKPVADASRATWLRRVSFDLVGLPPSPGEIQQFELDDSPDAYQRVVNRLLDSPQFGERWGRHWLDVARYGESTGKERNFVYLQAWRYRDYVIDSFNADKPYDQFITEQVAGDLLPAESSLQRDLNSIATGFLALNPKGINDRNRESFLLEIVDEQLESVTRGLMAITVTCARCHDHKYDPVPTADYYAIGGLFRNSEPKFGMLNRQRQINQADLLIPLQSPELKAGHQISSELLADLKSREEAWLELGRKVRTLRDALPPPPTLDREAVAKAEVKNVVRDGVLEVVSSARANIVKSEAELEVEKLEQQLRDENKAIEELRAQIALESQYIYHIGVTDRPQISDIPIRVRGEVDLVGEVVPRGFLQLIRLDGVPTPTSNSSGRLEFARWLTHPDHPLTARVYVNRVWSKLFGKGIVGTVDDFGSQGARPSHPELLDYLANRFIANGWSTKDLIREIVLSRVYGLDYLPDAANEAADIDNKLLWRANRRRLEAEALRDAVLALGGKLNFNRPAGSPLVELGTRELGVDADYEVLHRPYEFRSVYLPYLRGHPPEMLAVFDAADSSLTVGKRSETSGPDQALYILNSPLVMEQSRHVARRLLNAGANDADRVDLAFRLILGIAPRDEQRASAITALQNYRRLNGGLASAAGGVPEDQREIEVEVWGNLVHTIFALPDFRYVY